MSVQGLTFHLPHFGIDRPPRPADLPEARGLVAPAPAAANPAAPMAKAAPAKPARPPEPDPAVVLAAAVANARREAMEEAERDFAQQRAAEAERFEARLAEAREEWARTASDPLAGQVADAFSQMEQRIGETLGRILTPFLLAAVRERALTDLSGVIAGLVSDEHHPALRITGPDDLLDALRDRLGGGAGIDFQAADDVEIRVTADDTVVETQLRAWMDRLNEALA